MTNESTNSMVQMLAGSVRGIDSSRQLALGIAFGMMIGFLPKDNLIFAGLLVILILSGANLVTGFVSAVITTLCALQLQGLFHFTGEQVLGTDFVATLLAKLMEAPLVPWTDINNTVVCGGFFVGIAFFVPVYFVSFGLFQHFRSRLKKLLESSKGHRSPGLSAE